MIYKADANRPNKHWLWATLLLLPWIAKWWLPSYGTVEPRLSRMLVFYWRDFVWMVSAVAITTYACVKIKRRVADSFRARSTRV